MHVYGWGDTSENRSNDGISISPTNSACKPITYDCKQAIECSTMACVISSSRLASCGQLYLGCELRPIYYHNSHFESAINLEGVFDCNSPFEKLMVINLQLKQLRCSRRSDAPKLHTFCCWLTNPSATDIAERPLRYAPSMLEILTIPSPCDWLF